PSGRRWPPPRPPWPPSAPRRSGAGLPPRPIEAPLVPRSLSRRTLLKGAIAGGGLALARPALGGVAWGAAPAPPGTRPNPSLPEGVDTLPQIDHIVVVMMENHSFDNYLGMLGRGDGFTLDASGRPTAANPDGH